MGESGLPGVEELGRPAHRSLDENQRVSYEVTPGAKGPQATGVRPV
ncbi:MAG TPA: cold shock domain-containing protein [Sporichthyaceae bacterium]